MDVNTYITTVERARAYLVTMQPNEESCEILDEVYKLLKSDVTTHNVVRLKELVIQLEEQRC